MTLAGLVDSTPAALNKRNVVLDEDRFEQQFLLCGICKGRFHKNWLPRMLPCHHSFCQTCIDRLFQQASDNRHNQPAARPSHHYHSYSALRPLSSTPGAISMICPACNKPIPVTEEMIHKLPTDHRIVQLMDFVCHTERQTVTFCSRHSAHALNFFCETCIRPVCRECTVESHSEEEGHSVLDLEEALAKFTPLLDTAISEMDSEGEGIAEKRNKLEAVTQTLDSLKVDLLGQVKDCMSRMREQIDEREKALEEKVHEEIEKEKSKLLQKSGMLEERRLFLSEQGKKLRGARDENNVEEMFRVHHDVRERGDSRGVRIREVDDGLMTSFMLNTRDESLLVSRIKNFGDVTAKVDTTSARNKLSAQSYSNLYRSSSFR